MVSKKDYFSETALGKTYDLALIRRLIPYIKPYRLLFIVSILLVMLITLIDLSIPLLTQTAIDKYIAPQVLPTGSALNEPESTKQNIDKNGKGQIKYYRIDLTVSPHKEIVAKYKDLFLINGSEAMISYPDFDQIAEKDRQALRRGDLSGVVWLALLLLVLVCLNFLFNFLQVLTMETIGQSAMHDLRVFVYKHIQSLNIAFFTRNTVGRLVTRTTNDIQNMHEMFTKVVTFLFKDLFLLAGITIVLVVIHWKLALITYTVIPVVIIASLYFADLARDVFRRLRVKVAEINSKFSEMIQGIRVIQMFRQEKEFYTLFEQLNHENYLAGMEQIRIFAVFMPLIELLGSTTVALVIYFGGRDVIGQQISLGVLVAFISYMRMFFRPIRDITEKYNILQNAMSSAERIFLILDDQERIEAIPQSASPNAELQKIDSIEFRSVDFSYVPREMVLKNISFQIQAGQSLAVVGPTGAGKTSLINLIMRFYDPVAGQIRINQQDINTFEASRLRSRLAVVTQDPFLFSDTILHNIMDGRTKEEAQHINEILATANCKDFVDRLPNGVNTVLNEGGGSLSSGERQLLSIARAFAKNPDLIILDEATSYIDTGTEQKIQAAIDNLMAGRTSIIIAHRLSTAKKAKRILVLNHGRIVETGTHSELMEKGGLYYKLSLLK